MRPETIRGIVQATHGADMILDELERIGPYADRELELLRQEAIEGFLHANRLARKLLESPDEEPVR